jgi:hypothetical protein
MEQKLRTKIKPHVKYVWMMRATRPAIPATWQPIFNENMGSSEVLEVIILCLSCNVKKLKNNSQIVWKEQKQVLFW